MNNSLSRSAVHPLEQVPSKHRALLKCDGARHRGSSVWLQGGGGQREKRGCEPFAVHAARHPFAVHAPKQWAI